MFNVDLYLVIVYGNFDQNSLRGGWILSGCQVSKPFWPLWLFETLSVMGTEIATGLRPAKTPREVLLR